MGQDLFNPPHCTGGVLHATRKLCRDESSRTKERDEGTGGGGETLHDLVSRTSLAFPFPYNHLPVKSIFPSFNPRTYDPLLPPPFSAAAFTGAFTGAFIKVRDCSLGNSNGTSLLGDYGGSS